MNVLPEYQLFITTHCDSCNKVIAHLKNENISVITVNTDEENYNLPYPLMMFPALVKEKKLIGYGFNDIINHLKKI